jgi:hypothetical protein
LEIRRWKVFSIRKPAEKLSVVALSAVNFVEIYSVASKPHQIKAHFAAKCQCRPAGAATLPELAYPQRSPDRGLAEKAGDGQDLAPGVRSAAPQMIWWYSVQQIEDNKGVCFCSQCERPKENGCDTAAQRGRSGALQADLLLEKWLQVPSIIALR